MADDKLVTVKPVKTPEKKLDSVVFRALYRGMREPSPNLLTGMSFRLLGQMGKHMFVQMIVRRRKKQVMRYCHVPRFIGDPGFDIEPSDENQHLTPRIEKRRNEIRDMVLRGGNLWANPYTGEPGAWAGDGRTVAFPFVQMTQYMVESTLIYGGTGLRIEAGANEGEWPVTWFRPYPGPMIRLCAPEYDRQYRTDIKYPAYAILNRDDSVRFELTGSEFAYWCRDPNLSSDDDETLGYGVAELEGCVDLLTGLDTSYRYNVTQFTENKLPRGILQVPDVDPLVLEELLNTIEMNVSGATGGWHSIPYISVDTDSGKQAVQFIPLGDRPPDMQWERFIVFSINGLCNMYQIAPQEVGFQAFAMNKNTLQEADPQTEIIHGEDSGFVPLMVSFEDYFNQAVVNKFDDGAWKFVWKQLGHENEERANKLRKERMEIGYTASEEERTWGNRPIKRIPLEIDKWAQAQAEVLKKSPKVAQDPDKFYQAISELYVQAGGVWSAATMTPLSPSIMQYVGQEQMQLQQLQGQAQQQQMQQGGEQPPPDAQDGQQGAPQEQGGLDHQDNAFGVSETDEDMGAKPPPDPKEQPLGKSLGGKRVWAVTVEEGVSA